MSINSQNSQEDKQENMSLKKRPSNIEVASAIFDFAYQVRKFLLKKKFPEYSETQLHRLTLNDIDRANQR